jgi:hypothetical protein
MRCCVADQPGQTCPFEILTPYLIGAGIGVLSWAVFAVVNQPIGISTAISQVSGAVAEAAIGEGPVRANAYWAKHTPRWDYGTVFLVGTFIGALASAVVGRTFHLQVVPSVWAQRFGPSATRRMAGAFAGGVLAMYGARLAGGCTSGHGISGALQLALSSWVFLAVMFAAGMATAALMFRRGGAEA